MKNCIILFIFTILLVPNITAKISLKSGEKKSSDYNSPYWLPFQNSNKSNYSQAQPLVLGDGKLMIVYAVHSNPDTIYSRTSIDGSLIWSESHFITSVTKQSDNAYLCLSGIVTNTNRVIISYSVNDISVSATKIMKSDNNGASWSVPSNIYSTANVPLPSFTKSSDGKIFISGSNSAYFFSTNNGDSWAFKNVNSRFSSMIQTNNLDLLAFYPQNSGQNSQIYSKKSTDGGNTWNNPVLVASDTLSCERARVIKDSTGKLWLFYMVKKSGNFAGIYGNDIYFKTSTDNGSTWSASNRFTQYTGQDLDMNITLLNNQPYVTFNSDRWYGNRQFWGAKIGITTDGNPPPTIDSLYSETNTNSVNFKAFCSSYSGISSVKVSYKVNGTQKEPMLMYDDGQHGDNQANDNIYGLSLSGFSGGDVITCKFIVTDNNSNSITINGGSINILSSFVNRTEWMATGSLKNWYSSTGSEIEEGRTQEQPDGLRWPGIYPNQDMQVFKGLWVGAANFTDENSNSFPYKVVHAGPRVTGAGEFFPTRFQVINKFASPQVYVNGESANQYSVTCDSIDPNMKPDKMIINELNTQLGVTVTRKIMQFSHPQHDNYIVSEYTFTNTGNTNENSVIELPDNTITGLRIFYLNKYAICKETRFVIGNGSGWGMNTMLDARGDGVRPDTITEHYRTQFGWHGYWPSKNVPFNNIGGPIWNPGSQYGQQGDTVGRLGAAQFVGQLTLHADQSASNHNDDFSQPSTTKYYDGDSYLFSGNNSNDITRMTQEYNLMSSGHSSPRHAWVVTPSGDFALQTNPPEMGTSAGYLTCDGFGPYTLAHGESVNLVLVEGAAGLSREECIRIGKAYKNGSIDDITKNRLVLTGKDSLMKTWKMATENYQGDYNLQSVPFPPKEFRVNSQNSSINLTWQLFDNSNPANIYRIYRRMDKPDSTFIMIYEGPSGVLSYTDDHLVKGANYYYYIVAVDGNGISSNPNYTIASVPVKTILNVNSGSEVVKEYTLQPNYPNPFNPETNIKFSIPSGSNVRLTVFNSLGQKVKELVNSYKEAGSYEVKFSGKDLASGMYIYKLDAVSKDGKKNFSSSRKMLLVK